MSSPLWEGVREGCGTCAFGHRTENRHGDRVWVNVECRRFPPQMVQAIERGGYDGLTYEIVPCRPLMTEAEWCGEYKRKDT